MLLLGAVILGIFSVWFLVYYAPSLNTSLYLRTDLSDRILLKQFPKTLSDFATFLNNRLPTSVPGSKGLRNLRRFNFEWGKKREDIIYIEVNTSAKLSKEDVGEVFRFLNVQRERFNEDRYLVASFEDKTIPLNIDSVSSAEHENQYFINAVKDRLFSVLKPSDVQMLSKINAIGLLSEISPEGNMYYIVAYLKNMKGVDPEFIQKINGEIIQYRRNRDSINFFMSQMGRGLGYVMPEIGVAEENPNLWNIHDKLRIFGTVTFLIFLFVIFFSLVLLWRYRDEFRSSLKQG